MIQQHRDALNYTILPSFENWRAFTSISKSGYAYEVPLYSDAPLGFFGDWHAGPYRFYRLAPTNGLESRFKSILLMRVDVYMTKKDHDWFADLEKTNDAAYHGGYLDDEIAALLCLLLGIRLMPGSITREFGDGSDPRGTPAGSSVVPILAIGHGDTTIIPRLQRSVDIEKFPALFNTYPLLEKPDALMLVKAARQYQKATWYADADPSQAWLMLVSAVEAAAKHWSTVSRAASATNGKRGAKKAFIDFVVEFLSGPPGTRPGALGQFQFDDEPRLIEALKCIYHYRSRALHEGIPFPAPMCRLPGQYGGDNELAEIPTGQASGTAGSSWKHEDTPMALHTFEYIVRDSLNAWWQSIAQARQ